MRFLVLGYERSAHSGLFADWAGDRGHTLEVVDVPALADWPDPRMCDAVLALGSDCSVHASPDPWIVEEIAFLRTAHEMGVPVLGICFGAQALTKALGGEVRQAREVQLGWTRLPSTDTALIPPGPWFRWHEDVFSVPAGAREIVRAGDVPLAFPLAGAWPSSSTPRTIPGSSSDGSTAVVRSSPASASMPSGRGTNWSCLRGVRPRARTISSTGSGACGRRRLVSQTGRAQSTDRRATRVSLRFRQDRLDLCK
jgi:GMP synthase-like glutamine amidotransferase